MSDVILNDLDKRLLMELQYNFPIERNPFREIADRLGSTEEFIIKRIKELIEEEVIKRVGMYINFRAKGMEGALVAASIPPSTLDQFRRTALGIREITHNFIRNHPKYNVWFVIKSLNKEQLRNDVRSILSSIGVGEYVILYSKKNLKLSVKYDVIRGVSWGYNERTPDRIPTAEELGLKLEFLKSLSVPFEIVPDPFNKIAEKWNMKEEDLLELLRDLRKKHVIKDYGATINGEKVGIVENAMVLLQSNNIESSCHVLASEVKESTHVVLRETEEDWDYLCYCMIHGRNRNQLNEIASNIARITDAKSYMKLYSLDNLKPGVVM